jgi:hypothetical protein
MNEADDLINALIEHGAAEGRLIEVLARLMRANDELTAARKNDDEDQLERACA